MGRGSCQSFSVERGWRNSMILILAIKIFDKIHACNLICRLELAFSYFGSIGKRRLIAIHAVVANIMV